MPQCDLTVTQTLSGSTRTDTIDLRKGAVFGRIGQRDGEVQNYTIRTPEGVTSGNYANLLAFRGTPDDIPSVRSAMNSGRLIDLHHLFAWNPMTFGRNLVSDVIDPMLAVGGPGATSSVFFYANNSSLSVTQVKSEALSSAKTSGEATNAASPNTILQGILTTVLPFNQKLDTLLTLVDSGKATKGELAFYHNLIGVFFNVQVPSIASNIKGVSADPTGAGITATRLALLRDLIPFSLPAATPF
jgi:hypothetical protein